MDLVCHEAPEWAQLQVHFQAFKEGFDLQQAFGADPQRLEKLSQQAPYVFADLSKNWLL